MNALVNTLQAAKRIHGFCPSCREFFRLSDVLLFTTDRPPTTEFDHVEDQRERLERKIESWEDRRQELRLKDIRQGQINARAYVKRIAPFFVERKIEPKDVRVIFSPIKYVVFHGLADRQPRAVDLIDAPATSRQHETLQASVQHVIKAGNIEWRTLRVLEEGRVVPET
jgi:predicted Holliday junction resolvase-like endonuclease